MAYDDMPNRSPSYLVTAEEWNKIGDNFRAFEVFSLVAVFDGGGGVLTTNMVLDIPLDFKCTITAADLLMSEGWASDCSLTVDLWVDAAANYPPTSDDFVTGSAKFVGSSAAQSASINIATWTPGIATGSVARFRVESVALITKATCHLTLERST